MTVSADVQQLHASALRNETFVKSKISDDASTFCCISQLQGLMSVDNSSSKLF